MYIQAIWQFTIVKYVFGTQWTIVWIFFADLKPVQHGMHQRVMQRMETWINVVFTKFANLIFGYDCKRMPHLKIEIIIWKTILWPYDPQILKSKGTHYLHNIQRYCGSYSCTHSRPGFNIQTSQWNVETSMNQNELPFKMGPRLRRETRAFG